jgi:hypothetical protein
MPSADRAPIDRQPEPFDPNNLRRSVIAVPLREAIEQELDATKEFAELLKGHSATVFFLGDRPEEIAAARERVLKRLEKAVQELRELKELRDGIERQSIDPLLPELGNRASLASLRGRVISLLLAMDASSDPLTDGGKPAPPAIDHIWPTRFEVIIDINLNFNPPEGTTRAERDELEQPDAGHIARKWIAKYVEEAKKKAQIDDPDQGIDKEKTRLSAQYVFARLEGKVIQVLVAIDQRAAQRLAKEEAKAAARRVKETLRGAGKSGVPEPRRDPAITPAEAKRRAAVKLAAEEKKLTARFRTIHHIWPDFKLRSCISASIYTVKADAAHRSFTTSGKGITWAVWIPASTARTPLSAAQNHRSGLDLSQTSKLSDARQRVARSIRSRHVSRNHRRRAVARERRQGFGDGLRLARARRSGRGAGGPVRRRRATGDHETNYGRGHQRHRAAVPTCQPEGARPLRYG